MVFTQTFQLNVNQERQGNAVGLTIPGVGSGGLNSRDSQAGMEITDALIMENWVGDVGKIVTRKGYSEAATGASGNIETILEYHAGTTRTMISASGSVVYSGNSGSLTSIGTGFSNARWQGFMMNGNLLMFNGQDTPQKYDGSTLSTNSFTGSGLTATQLIGGTVHKKRLFLFTGSAPEFWYGAVDAISGSLTKFDLSRVTKRGGALMGCASWSIDGGAGLDDMIVFFMSTGDAIVYSGSDPSSANDWSLVGVYRMSAPIHQRAIVELAGDILILTQYDLVSFSQIYKLGETPDTSSKISGAIKEAIRSYGSNYGWQIINFPKENLLLINVPEATNTRYSQFVLNTLTGAFSKFTGWNARTFGIYNNNLYFGGNTKIYLGYDGLDDDGDSIATDLKLAFSNLGVPSPKTVNYYKPVLSSDANVTLSLSLFYDFKASGLVQSVSSTSEGTAWGSAWGSAWSPEVKVKDTQYSASGQGTYISLRIKTTLNGQQLSFYSLYYSFNVDNL